MRKAKLAILISGRGSNMAALVYAAKLPDCPYEVVLVAANDPDAAGLKLAQAEGIATFAQSHKGMKRAEFDQIITDQVRQAGADYIALAGYMRLLSSEFVDTWAGRVINIHPSLLPKHKGLDTHQAAIDAGDSHAGCSVHVVTVELDDGPVLGQIAVAILPDDTADTLAARVLTAEHQLYSRTLSDYVMRDKTPAGLLAKVREVAFALPEVDEVMSHGMNSFGIIGGKKFAYFTDNHHSDGITAVLVKTAGAEEQAMLFEADDAVYYKPAYFGPSGWVGIRLDDDPDWDVIADRMARSWRMIAPKKLAGLMAVADEF